MKNTFFEKIRLEILCAARRVNQCAEDHDVNRNHVNYGVATAYASVLRDLGHDVDVPCWEDNGCLKIPKIKFDGEELAV